jgi:hypothetical protein
MDSPTITGTPSMSQAQFAQHVVREPTLANRARFEGLKQLHSPAKDAQRPGFRRVAAKREQDAVCVYDHDANTDARAGSIPRSLLAASSFYVPPTCALDDSIS